MVLSSNHSVRSVINTDRWDAQSRCRERRDRDRDNGLSLADSFRWREPFAHETDVNMRLRVSSEAIDSEHTETLVTHSTLLNSEQDLSRAAQRGVTNVLFNGARWIAATEGDFLYVPEGGIHAFTSDPADRASMLILFAPGAPREAYFEELAEIAASGRQLTDEEWIELGRRHDNYFI